MRIHQFHRFTSRNRPPHQRIQQRLLLHRCHTQDGHLVGGYIGIHPQHPWERGQEGSDGTGAAAAGHVHFEKHFFHVVVVVVGGGDGGGGDGGGGGKK